MHPTGNSAIASMYGLLLPERDSELLPFIPHGGGALQFADIAAARHAVTLLGRSDWILTCDDAVVEVSPSIARAIGQAGRIPFTTYWVWAAVRRVLGAERLPGFAFGSYKVSYSVLPAASSVNGESLAVGLGVLVHRAEAGRWQKVATLASSRFISRRGALRHGAFADECGELVDAYRSAARSNGGLLRRIAEDIGHLVVALGEVAPTRAQAFIEPFSVYWSGKSLKGRRLQSGLAAKTAPGQRADFSAAVTAPGLATIVRLYGELDFDTPCLSGCSGTLEHATAAASADNRLRPFERELLGHLRAGGLACDCRLLKASLLCRAAISEGRRAPRGGYRMTVVPGHNPDSYDLYGSFRCGSLERLSEVAAAALNRHWAIYDDAASSSWGFADRAAAISSRWPRE